MPLPITAEAPVLTLRSVNNGVSSTETVCADGEVAAVIEAPSMQQTPVVCSFAGGCTFTIMQNAPIAGTVNTNGLTSNVASGKIKITVCGMKAPLRTNQSTPASTVLELPAIKTVVSQAAAISTRSELIQPEVEIASDASLKGILFDGETLPGLKSTSENCFVGFSLTHLATASYRKKAIVDEFRFFMDYFQDRSRYADKLLFQGSNDDF